MTESCLYHVSFDTLPYLEAFQLQERAVELQRQGLFPDLLLTLEHPPTVTVGVSGSLADLNVSESFLRSQGINVVQTNRGGKITYHGPGQLVIYPLLDLRTLKLPPRKYLSLLEEITIEILSEWGVQSSRRDDRPGVWVEDRKIASIGIRLRAGRTMHGLAVNLNTDLTPFSYFAPCGMPEVVTTSLHRECNQPIEREQVRQRFAQKLAERLGVDLEELSRSDRRFLSCLNRDFWD
ncbi:MAG: lipoyl(octanoyl) transferase LipB [bacterium]